MTQIGMLLPTLDAIGGAERQVILLSKELAARGWRVTVITLSGTATGCREELADAGVAFLSLNMRKAWIDPRGWLRYMAWATVHRPEIIHTHLPHATWFARCIRLLTPVRVQLDTIHTSNSGSRARRLTYRFTNWLTNCITCVSAAVAHNAEMAGLAPRQLLMILPNGVLPPKLPAQERNRPDFPIFHWIAVGRLSPVKDYPTLLRAFATLADEPTLTIAGSGPEEPYLRSLSAQLNIDRRVHFAGFHSDIQPLLAAADAFVLSSLWEGLPISVLEAAAAGLPTVATDGAGTREAILANITGLLTPVGDSEALAGAMATIMAISPTQRCAMGTRARQFVSERFALPAVADRWEQLYSQLLASHTRPSRHG